MSSCKTSKIISTLTRSPTEYLIYIYTIPFESTSLYWRCRLGRDNRILHNVSITQRWPTTLQAQKHIIMQWFPCGHNGQWYNNSGSLWTWEPIQYLIRYREISRPGLVCGMGLCVKGEYRSDIWQAPLQQCGREVSQIPLWWWNLRANQEQNIDNTSFLIPNWSFCFKLFDFWKFTDQSHTYLTCHSRPEPDNYNVYITVKSLI